MPNASPADDLAPGAPAMGWRRAAYGVVLAVTLWRVVGLWFDRTDLFVDESQYWLWGQSLDFGYYSKPPLIAWVIRGVTALAGSDSAFWIRFPAPWFHAATALILARIAARQWGPSAAVWTAATYVTLPFTVVGSAIISTDTIMAPYFAAAIAFYLRLTETRRPVFAGLAGAAIGFAFLAKYAAVYFLVGAVLSAVLVPQARVGWRNALLLVLTFLAVISPNVLWNLSHDLTTVQHTADNIGWMRAASPMTGLSLRSLGSFLGSQFAVFGPVLFTVLLWSFVRPRAQAVRVLTLFAIPALLAVSVQALLSKAYANWAVSAYFAGTLIVVALLHHRARWLLWLSLALHALAVLAIPVATVIAPELHLGRDRPLLARYLGRSDLSRQIVALAQQTGLTTVVAADRDILADLFHTGRGSGLTFRAIPPDGRPRNFYEQTLALPPDQTGSVLAVLSAPPDCGTGAVPAIATFDTTRGAYARLRLAAYVLEAACVTDRP